MRMTGPKPKLRWFQYSLRTLLVFVTLCVVLCSWLTVKRQQARRQWEAKEHVYKLRGTMGVHLNPIWPEWLVGLLGFEYFKPHASHRRRREEIPNGIATLQGYSLT